MGGRRRPHVTSDLSLAVPPWTARRVVARWGKLRERASLVQRPERGSLGSQARTRSQTNPSSFGRRLRGFFGRVDCGMWRERRERRGPESRSDGRGMQGRRRLHGVTRRLLPRCTLGRVLRQGDLRSHLRLDTRDRALPARMPGWFLRDGPAQLGLARSQMARALLNRNRFCSCPWRSRRSTPPTA